MPTPRRPVPPQVKSRWQARSACKSNAFRTRRTGRRGIWQPAPSGDRDGAGVAPKRRMRAVAVEARLDAPRADAAVRVLAREDRVAPAALRVGLDGALERLPEAARRRVPDDDAGACARGLDGAAGGHGLVGRMRRAGTARAQAIDR